MESWIYSPLIYKKLIIHDDPKPSRVGLAQTTEIRFFQSLSADCCLLVQSPLVKESPIKRPDQGRKTYRVSNTFDRTPNLTTRESTGRSSVKKSGSSRLLSRVTIWVLKFALFFSIGRLVCSYLDYLFSLRFAADIVYARPTKAVRVLNSFLSFSFVLRSAELFLGYFSVKCLGVAEFFSFFLFKWRPGNFDRWVSLQFRPPPFFFLGKVNILDFFYLEKKREW